MLKRVLASLLWSLLVFPRGALAQTALYEETGVEGSPYEDMAEGESRDVPCPYGLSATVDGHYGVPFGDYMFMSDWQSKKSDFPLPAWNRYYAVPVRSVISNDRKARWDNAEIQVHCWVYRAMYLIQRHYDVVAVSGTLVELCEDDWERIDIEAYDDVGTAQGSTTLSTCGGDGGGGGGGGDGGSVWTCYTVTIEHYWYYPDTGQTEYRYTEEQTYCEQTA
jgi:hypothetical protein